MLETKRDGVERTLEAIVRDYFSDTPILVEIARCETRFRHYDREGKTLRGAVDSGDVGIMQVNERYHRTRAEKLGFDIDVLEGNLAYAKYLYREEGSDPWRSSAGCWGGYREIVAKSAAPKLKVFSRISLPPAQNNLD